ncbi:L,D-transpeptidase-like protein [Actinoallomurus bryophytorum]|uniref:L,D-transpeptidase-like protein n=1 Tax=Actinoallomurus bryophytorum TaxID=1490222 RepID=A0A543CI94_9ACTN|nr:Ig-like domain-containing protein [Actinoallomurus bryophytorum]TQL96819.1 L,D-transpeptidase-like protein [Actinoallomurus bryophytorum]
MSNRRSAVALIMAALLAGACACTSSEAGTNGKNGTKAPDAQVRITPVDGTAKARPDQGITVAAEGGKLDQVSVVSGNKPVPGAFNADHTQWKTTWTLKPGAAYAVNASGKSPEGKAVSATSKFTAQKATQTFSISDVTPMPGEKVGVGMPIIVTFDKAIANRAYVEKALEVKSDKNDVGAWHWISDQQVVYRTQKYWQPHQNITFTAHMAGVRGLKGVYGTQDVTKSFKIGASNITVANSKTHYMKVNHDGTVKKFPISTGMGTTREYTTASGIHLTKEKATMVHMVSPGRKKGDPGYYSEDIPLAVRISDRGEYIHESPGQFYALGHSNISHGCVRTSPTGARWFYNIAQRGDPVNVTGTDRKLEPGNGWTFWNQSWTSWVKGSALH